MSFYEDQLDAIEARNFGPHYHPKREKTLKEKEAETPSRLKSLYAKLTQATTEKGKPDGHG